MVTLRNGLKRLVGDEDGKVLIMALVALVVGALLLTPLLGFMSSGLIAGQVYENKTSELYAADAGVMDAIWKIQSGHVREPRGCDNPTEFPYDYSIADLINHRNVNVSIDYVDNQTFRITSKAAGDRDSVTTIESYVFYGSEWGILLDFGVVALDGNIHIGQNTVLDSYPERFSCHIYAQSKDPEDPEKGNIDIVGNSEVYGLATATGDITVGSRAKLTPGPALNDYPPLEFNLPDIDKYFNEASNGGVHEGDLTVNESRTLGPVHITGDLNIGGNAVLTLGGPVWVDGKVTAGGTASIEGKGPLVAVRKITVTGTDKPAPDEVPVLISTQDTIGATGTGQVYAVLYAPNARITIDGTAGVNGAIIAESVHISTAGKTEVRYDLTVVDRVRVPGLKIHTWEIT